MIAYDTKWQGITLSLLRFVTGLCFLSVGVAKLFNFPPGNSFPHPLPTLLLAAGMLELVCGSLITVGLFTRAAAFIVSGEMAIAYFLSHAPRSFFPVLNGGSAAILYCFIFFYLVFSGAGPVSLDHLIWGKRR